MRATFSEQQELLRQTAHEFARRELEPHAAEVDEQERFPMEQFRGLAALGLLGLTVPEADGGAGGGYSELAVVIEELAAACGSTSTVFVTHVSLGTACIARYGNAEQRKRWLPALARGERIAAFALSEPGSGSDALALQTTATRDGDEYVLNGSKIFITNGEVADVFVVFVNSDKEQGYRGINAIVVERGAPGFAVTHMAGKMGMRGSATSELVFQESRVPAANRLDDEGKGYAVALSILSTSRVSIAAQCIGLARGAYEAGVTYATQRKTFGKHLADHQAIQFMLADMATEIDAARLLTHRAAWLVDKDLPHVMETAMAKLFASEVANRVAHKALQIHGGSGYFRPSKVERVYRDQRVTEIYEGTSEIQRLIIARSILKDGAT